MTEEISFELIQDFRKMSTAEGIPSTKVEYRDSETGELKVFDTGHYGDSMFDTPFWEAAERAYSKAQKAKKQKPHKGFGKPK